MPTSFHLCFLDRGQPGEYGRDFIQFHFCSFSSLPGSGIDSSGLGLHAGMKTLWKYLLELCFDLSPCRSITLALSLCPWGQSKPFLLHCRYYAGSGPPSPSHLLLSHPLPPSVFVTLGHLRSPRHSSALPMLGPRSECLVPLFSPLQIPLSSNITSVRKPSRFLQAGGNQSVPSQSTHV